jgi:phosphoglycolate phosphatase-like HAD superfamily hydrolase
MIKVIIFDFDGVILESVSVKTDAFRKLFSFTPSHVDEIVRFHIQNGGMSRYDKFRYIYSDILHEELSDKQMDWLSQQFTELTISGVKNAKYVTGILNFLEKYHSKFIFYIVSATPQNELNDIVNQRGLARFFSDVLGSPERKEANLKKICASVDVPENDIIFIGDSLNDWKATWSTGIRFIGRVKPGDPEIFAELPNVENVITNFHDMDQIIGELP